MLNWWMRRAHRFSLWKENVGSGTASVSFGRGELGIGPVENVIL